MSQAGVQARITRLLIPLAMVIIVAAACGSSAPAAAPAAGAQTGGQVTLEKPYDEKADAKADIAAAMKAAKGDSKYVLIDFGANWCEDCLVLSKLFEDPAVQPVLDKNYHVVKVDVGYWDKNTDVADQYGNPIKVGIPALVVLKPDGTMVASTKAGELANARTATAQDILGYLTKWAPKAQ